jgi:hypothetical protein
MTAKGSVDKMHIELAELKQAIERAKYTTGQNSIIFQNDPEDPTTLESHRLGVNDTNVTVEIGPANFPGFEWYIAYKRGCAGGR